MIWQLLGGIGLALLVIACAMNDMKQALKEGKLWDEEVRPCRK